jgi:hypothetical protein
MFAYVFSTCHMHIQRPEQGTSTPRARRHDHIQRPHRIGAPQHPPRTWARPSPGVSAGTVIPAPPAHVGTTRFMGSPTVGMTSTPRARGHDAQADFSHEWPVQHPPRTWARPWHTARIASSSPAPPAHVGTTLGKQRLRRDVPSTPRARGHDVRPLCYVHRMPQHPPRTWARRQRRHRRASVLPAPPAHVGTTPAGSRQPVVVPTW